MPKAFAWFILISLLAVVCCGPVGYYLQKQYWKKEMHSRLLQTPVGELSHIQLSAQEWAAVPREGDHEIFYQGRWYDLLSVDIQKEKVSIRALADEKEKEILAGFEKRQPTPGQQCWIKWLSTPFILPSVLSGATMSELLFHADRHPSQDLPCITGRRPEEPPCSCSLIS